MHMPLDELSDRISTADANATLVLAIVDRGGGATELYASEGISFNWIFRADDFRAT